MAGGLLPRTRLEQLVRQLRRTQAEFQKDFARTSDQLDERLTVPTRQVTRWLAGELDGIPYAAACRVLEQMFGERAERLFGPPDPTPRAEVATVEVPGPALVASTPVEDVALQREVAMAAAESARFGQFAEQSNVGPHTLDQFRADLTRIVTTYPNRPVYNASFDLGWLHAAETQARTAFLCAELAGNNALRAWVRGTQSLVAYWDERPCAAIELAADGWRYVPETGTARVRLASIEARAHARLRDQRATENALARAEQAREEVRGADDPGGMLTFPVAKQNFYAATAQLWLGGQDSYIDAERDAAHAVELYEADPPEQRRLGELCLARLDLAAARLGRDDLDGAVEQLQCVLTIAAQRRTDSVVRRLNQVGRALQRPRYQTSSLALDLHDQIRSFTGDCTPPALSGASE